MMCIIFTEIKMIQLENVNPQRDSTVLKREWLQESTFFLAVHDTSLGLQVLILCVWSQCDFCQSQCPKKRITPTKIAIYLNWIQCVMIKWSVYLHITFKCLNYLQRSHQNKTSLNLKTKQKCMPLFRSRIGYFILKEMGVWKPNELKRVAFFQNKVCMWLSFSETMCYFPWLRSWAMNPKGHDFELLPCYFLVTLNMLFLSLYLHIYVKCSTVSLWRCL